VLSFWYSDDAQGAFCCAHYLAGNIAFVVAYQIKGVFLTRPERCLHPPASSVRGVRPLWLRRLSLVSSPLTDRIQIIRSPSAVAVGPLLLCSPGLPIIGDCCRLAGPLIESRLHRLRRSTSSNCRFKYHKDQRLSRRAGCMFHPPLGSRPRQEDCKHPCHSTVAGHGTIQPQSHHYACLPSSLCSDFPSLIVGLLSPLACPTYEHTSFCLYLR